MNRKFPSICTIGVLLSLSSLVSVAQKADLSPERNQAIKELIRKYKTDARGPYQDIRWFCNDGTFNQPKEPCPQNIGGVQRARYKDEVIRLGKSDHVFLGQILATTVINDFWDQDNYHSRLKQYQIEKWLKTIDDGWINQKAQFYRGATQAEDEETWGREFFIKILAKDENLLKNYYLLREAAKDIPHRGDDNVAQLMRSESKAISDVYEPFMNLRIKIHGQPEASDIARVRKFKTDRSQQLTPALNQKLDQLVQTMQRFFKPVDITSFTQLAQPITDSDLKDKVWSFTQNAPNLAVPRKLEETANLMWYIRENLWKERVPGGRLALLDISLNLEKLFLQETAKSPSDNLSQLIDRIYVTGMATAACGYVEKWEWEQLAETLKPNGEGELTVSYLNKFLVAARSQLEWGTGMSKAVYEPTLNVYQGFEPMAHGFIDDRIRGSVALPLGNYIGVLGSFIATATSLSNQVLNIPNQSHVRGLNPGYAQGVLTVVPGTAEDLEVDPTGIYIFDRPPADLKPIAGIATVSEGNLVSHVQLLARNLGIPNAAISIDNLNELKKYHGKEVFYAVSNRGNVIVKLAGDMSAVEKALFEKKSRSEDMITVPVDRIELDVNQVLNLRSVTAEASGQLCGPKAANLGELKSFFPENVVEGLVIPFGIFLDHMRQQIPGDSRSYWEYLNEIFREARALSASGTDAAAIESYQLKELEKLRTLIKQMPLKASFQKDIADQFQSVFGKPLGQVPVFLRSDTNMEDLKDFSGAGLNLTLFNVLDQQQILDGIKNVWASPYTERSFKWRQKYLLNPENVYPSILIIPSVNNDYSGVIITKGLLTGNPGEITVAFSRGVGGAVEGQASETWVLRGKVFKQLVSPSREPMLTWLPLTGGSQKRYTTFEQPILSDENLNVIRNFRVHLLRNLRSKGLQGPFDVELGFKDNKLWLFQVRPFVENKRVLSSEYLQSITPKIDGSKKINTTTKI